MSTQEIIEMALKLDPSERLIVIDTLSASVTPTDPEIDRLWGEEAMRRLEAYRRGDVVGVPMEEVFGKR